MFRKLVGGGGGMEGSVALIKKRSTMFIAAEQLSALTLFDYLGDTNL